MKDSKLIDSSVWIVYFFNGMHKEIIDSDEMLLLSVLSLFEIRKSLSKNKIAEDKIKKSMEFVKRRSLTIEVNTEIAEKAVDFSLENGLPIIDSIIYATSVMNESILVTLDNDFRGLKGVVLK